MDAMRLKQLFGIGAIFLALITEIVFNSLSTVVIPLHTAGRIDNCAILNKICSSPSN